MKKNKEKYSPQITEDNLSFIEKILFQTNKPLSLDELTNKLAYKKTSSQLSQEVKKYDPYCKYDVGDFIYKEYDESLTVSSKGAEQFKGAVVLEVVGKTPYKDFNCEMLEVDYSGGGIFRKYIDYMKKTKTQVLIPSNLEGKAKAPESIERKEDPRLSQLPMTERDLKSLEKNLKKSLSKSPKFFTWGDYWQLVEKRIEVKEEKINAIKSHLQETKTSTETKDLVSQFFKIKGEDDLFDLYCMSLSFTLDKKYKKDFVFTYPLGWGKWHLKKILNSITQNLPLSAPLAKLPPAAEEKKAETGESQKFPVKLYLTWREVLSGGIKIPETLKKEFAHSREYIFRDIETERDYAIYYYPSSQFCLGLKDFYESNNVPQGALLTLERENPFHYNIWLKKSKKKISVMKITYNSKEDQFGQTGEEVFTFCIPNKIIHLQRETLIKALSLYPQRKGLDLRELLVVIFKNFSLERGDYSLHYLRAYHLVDTLKLTTQRDIEKVLLSTPEFVKSEKGKGIYFYREKIEVEEEVKPEEIPEIPPEVVPKMHIEQRVEEAPAAPSLTELPAEEILSPEIEEEKREEVRMEAPIEIDKREIEEAREKPPPPQKEKDFKKRRMEAERERRARRGIKKQIEEKIEIEELEQEAFIAVKSKQEEARTEVPRTEEKKKIKPYVADQPVFGIFAEKLKSALDKKENGKEKGKEEGKKKK